jgi:UDP-2,3-diacylglucosamine pyrophosphatase LpxH
MTDFSVSGGSLPAHNTYYRSIWISDFHLGTVWCKSQELLGFMRSHCAETLFLVGDVIDCWNVGPSWHWDPTQTAIIEEIWAWRRRGTRIVFLPGNHDERNCNLIRILFGEVECTPHLVYRTAEGRRMLVIHGHQFDGSIHPARWLSVIGSPAYSTALKLNLWYNRDRRRSSGHRANAIACVRGHVKKLVHWLVDFNDSRVYDAARAHTVDGVICGHTHRPDYRNIGPFLYVNDGDWVQSRTALVEQTNGVLRLLRSNQSGRASDKEGSAYEQVLSNAAMAGSQD